MTSRFTPLKTKKNFELIIDLLKEKIFSGEYRPGDRLPSERDLAEMIRVSRLSVREAFRALEISGIIEIRKGTDGGAFIQEPTHGSVTRGIHDLIRMGGITLADLTEARLFLEKSVVELAAERVAEEDLESLEFWLKKSEEKLGSGERAVEEGIRFHRSLAAISRNPVLVMLHSSIMDLLHLFLKKIPTDLETSRKTTDEHHEIYRCLKQGDAGRLIEVLIRHIQNANDWLMKSAADHHAPGKQPKPVSALHGIPGADHNR